MTNQMTLDRAAQNRALVKAGYEAFARGDIASVVKDLDADIRWHLLLPGPLGGDHNGVAEVVEFFKQLGQRSGGTLRMEINDILASDTQAMVDVRVRATRGSKSLDSHQVHLFQYRNEKVIEVWQFVDDASHGDFWT